MNDAARPPQGPPRVEHLKQRLQYQDKAVVSRVLARNAGGNVTLFAVDAGEGLRARDARSARLAPRLQAVACHSAAQKWHALPPMTNRCHTKCA